jgi:uroporphyrinogen-III decarboxylase
MATGTTDDVRAYCANLMDLFGDAPGYIMAHGCYFENTTDEKLRAFMDSVKK